MGVARRSRHDRHKVRLRRRSVRRLHGAYRRRRDSFLSHQRRQHRRIRDHHNRDDRRDAGWRKDPEGLARSRSRSMRLLPVGPDHVRFGAAGEQPDIQRTPISTTRCPATSAVAGPMSAFAKRSSWPRNRPEGRDDNDPRSHRSSLRRSGIFFGERSLPAQVPPGRSGGRRRPDAEPEPAVRQRRRSRPPRPAVLRRTPSSASTATGKSS